MFIEIDRQQHDTAAAVLVWLKLADRPAVQQGEAFVIGAGATAGEALVDARRQLLTVDTIILDLLERTDGSRQVALVEGHNSHG